MGTEYQYFQSLMEKYPSLKDLVFYLNQSYRVGDNIPSERDLAMIVGYPRTSLRESLIRLECFGFITNAHGKPKVLLKDFSTVVNNGTQN
ncbi:GntR family transcriptional regulator [Alteromonas sp. ZYF713]|nr:GntR family transcriptional regulator [Alteromonas sp. ZYF713]